MLMRRYYYYLLFCFFCSTGFAQQQQEWRTLIDKKQFEQVISQAADMQAADSADFSKMYIVGQAYEGLLKYRDAYNCYSLCYELDSTRIDMINTLARIAGSLGKVKESEKFYKQVLGYDSTNFHANYQLARLYIQLGNSAEGTKYYEYLLERDPENPILLRALGDCYTLMGWLYDAKDCYYKAYYNNVENAPLASLLINTLLGLYHPSLNDFLDVAFSVCDTAMSYHPKDISLRQKKAMIYYTKAEYLKSDSVYTSLMADSDSSFITLKYCGLSRYHTRNWYDAIEPFEKAFDKDTTAGDICIMLGISLGRTYDVMRSFEYFDKAESLMTPDEYWYNMLIQFRAEMYVKIGECDKGAELYYQLWNNSKKQISWLQRLTSCYGREKLSEMPDERKQRYLFVCFLYASEVKDASEVPEDVTLSSSLLHLRSTLEKFNEEMFFRGLKSLPMTSPDNKKNTLSAEKLKELIDKLYKK